MVKGPIVQVDLQADISKTDILEVSLTSVVKDISAEDTGAGSEFWSILTPNFSGLSKTARRKSGSVTVLSNVFTELYLFFGLETICIALFIE